MEAFSQTKEMIMLSKELLYKTLATEELSRFLRGYMKGTQLHYARTLASAIACDCCAVVTTAKLTVVWCF